MDRTSCSKFRANQFRVLLTLAAYVLFQELRRRAARTVCADAQVTTLRERLVKLAVWVQRSARRIVLHLPLSFPWLPMWRQLACAIGRRRRPSDRARSLPDLGGRVIGGASSTSRLALAERLKGSSHRFFAPNSYPRRRLWRRSAAWRIGGHVRVRS